MEKRKNKQANKQIEKKMRQVRGGWGEGGMGILCEGIEIIKYYSIFKFLVSLIKKYTHTW